MAGLWEPMRGHIMAMVRCEVLEGPRDGFKTVGIAGATGNTEYLAIEEKFLVHEDGESFLPVLVIGYDARYNTALVQLPYEADSGAKRVWVLKGTLKTEEADKAYA